MSVKWAVVSAYRSVHYSSERKSWLFKDDWRSQRTLFLAIDSLIRRNTMVTQDQACAPPASLQWPKDKLLHMTEEPWQMETSQEYPATNQCPVRLWRRQSKAGQTFHVLVRD